MHHCHLLSVCENGRVRDSMSESSDVMSASLLAYGLTCGIDMARAWGPVSTPFHGSSSIPHQDLL
jgi:hypothetical protein